MEVKQMNSTLLKEKIDESGYKIRGLAERIGISYQALYNKINGKTEFVTSEIVALTSLLSLNRAEQFKIFFS